MKDYRIHFAEGERERVLSFLSRSNDVVINEVEANSVFVTIQLDDEMADIHHSKLLAQIEGRIVTPQNAVDKNNPANNDIAVV